MPQCRRSKSWGETFDSCWSPSVQEDRIDPRKRHRARRAIAQALYQWQLNPVSAEQLHSEFEETGSLKRADATFFDAVIQGVLSGSDKLDATFGPYLDRPIDALGYVERGMLWAGTYELVETPNTPYKVVINEWVELARVFGAEQSHKYINGVLDAVAKSLQGHAEGV